MQGTEEEEGESTIMGQHVARDIMSIIERGLDLLELEHSVCINACESDGNDEDNQNTTAMEIIQPDAWIRRLCQWGDENRILMKNGLGEETIIDVGDTRN